MGTVNVVNMIPVSLSGETNQDSEPNIAVNPEHTTDMVGTAFTPAPLGGSYAPIYVSTDGGNTWTLRTVVPDNGSFGTGDITVSFATSGGMLYAAILSGTVSLRMKILRTTSFTSVNPMTTLVQRDDVDQPWILAGSVVVSGVSKDRVYVGNNYFDQPNGRTATVDASQDAATPPPPAGFTPLQLERRTTIGQDGPPIRTALHSSGVVYAAFYRWVSGTFPNFNVDIVVTRDDNWGASANPFSSLVDTGDGAIGQRVATNRFTRWNASMGQERLGADLAIAVNPNDAHQVWIAWADRVGGPTGTDWTLHVRSSADSGQTWSADVRTVTNAKNPSLAVNSGGLLGFVYQQYTGTQWVTKLELTSNAWGTAAETHVLHQAPANLPSRTFWPFLGDYIRLLAVGSDFYGVFCGNNTPDMANFPSGVTYQRHADWNSHTLLNNNGVSPVAISIDPFFFHWYQMLVPRSPIIGPITRGPIPRGPIAREPIITRGPIYPEPPGPISPEARPPTAKTALSGSKKTKGGARKRTSKKPKPPTNIKL